MQIKSTFYTTPHMIIQETLNSDYNQRLDIWFHFIRIKTKIMVNMRKITRSMTKSRSTASEVIAKKKKKKVKKRLFVEENCK